MPKPLSVQVNGFDSSNGRGDASKHGIKIPPGALIGSRTANGLASLNSSPPKLAISSPSARRGSQTKGDTSSKYGSPFNACAMTRAAPSFEHDLVFRSPSDRIASYHSPKAMKLTKDLLEKRPSAHDTLHATKLSQHKHSGSPKKMPNKSEVSVSYDDLNNHGESSEYGEPSESRMKFHRHREVPLKKIDIISPLSKEEIEWIDKFDSFMSGIGSDSIAPIKKEWIYNACEGARIDAFTINKTELDHMVDEMLSEMNDMYIDSVRLSIAEYLLLHQPERKRLEILETPREINLKHRLEFAFGESMNRGNNIPPLTWTESVRQARENIASKLFSVNSCILEIQRIWMKENVSKSYENSLLFDVTNSGSTKTLELDKFKISQIDYCESVRNALKKKWLPEIIKSLLRPPYEVHEDLIKSKSNLFRSISVLLTRQLRGLLEASCNHLAQYFEEFHPLNEDEIEASSIGANEIKISPALFVKLMIRGNQIRVEPTLEEMESTLSAIIDQAVSAVEGFPVIEHSDMTSCSPFAESSGPNEEHLVTDEKLDEDASNLAAQLFDNSDGLNCLRVVRHEEESIRSAMSRIAHVIEANLEGPKRIVKSFEQFVHEYNNLLSIDHVKIGEEFKHAKHSLDDYRKEIHRYRKAADDVKDLTIDEVQMGLFVVQTEPLKRGISLKANAIADTLLQQVLVETNEEMEEICQRFEGLNSRAMEKPKESHEMKALKAYLEAAPQEQALLQIKIEKVVKGMDFLHELGKEIPDDIMMLNTKTYLWPDKIVPVLDAAMERILTQEEKMEDQLRERQKKFEEAVDATTQEIDTFEELGDSKVVENYLQQATKVRTTLEDLQEELNRINEQEEIFGWNPTVNPQVEQNLKKLEPFESLFKIVYETQQLIEAMLHGSILDLDPEKVESDVDSAWRQAYKYTKTYSEKPNLLALSESMKDLIGSFKPHVPLVAILCNGGLRSRHWEAFAQVVGFSIKPNERTSLQDMIDKKLEPHIPKMEEISDSASKEWSLEKNLDKQLSEWKEIEFSMQPYRDTGTSILGGSSVDEIQAILDDQIVKTQTMLASPYIKVFIQRAKDWDEFLQTTQEVIDYWLKVQAQWLYLEPIFASDDIKKQMPREAERFGQVDNVFRTTVSRCMEDPKVLKFVKTDGLIDSLKESFELLDLINKGLNAYLEQKRLFFPRFFFLSNDELLEILAETKDPLRVQPHLKKCFEAISKLNFNDDLIAEGMISGEGENVPWPRKINPAEARGAVEKWLLQTEGMMKEAVREQCSKGRVSYQEMNREKWVLEWPGMVVIAIGQMHWTSEVEQAIVDPSGQGVRKYAEKCTRQLDDIVELVRGTLTKLQRSSIGAMVVLDVHARDMTVNLADEGVKSNLDFSWLAQLRYYWEENDVVCKMITAEIKYGYEYLGVSSRLVVTPLTDRAYRTLMGALQLYLGGAPEGPAGTGKTETTKDLAKAIANYCVVFNCSDGLDYLAMGKFFKGVASCGAWACFDEFNRIELEVLSVVAQQIMVIQRNVQLGSTQFEFEGSTLQLVRSCAVFITMNPGYAGRSELPDNLKVLFRTVAMMVPDYAMIGEILLMSFGFSDARVLAKKIVATYKLCSEQLSSQTHYDYGMRAVMAVLRAAGNLKQVYTDQDEAILMLRAIRDVNVPKFLSHDLPLFEGIAKDLFPGVELPKPDYLNMLSAINWSCEQSNLQPEKYFIQKTIELYEMIVVRHGLMVVGLSYGGKTRSYRVLSDSLGKLNELGQNEENKVRIYTMNPKSVTLGQLYGQFDPVSHEWTDGILAINFRAAASDQTPDRKWVLFDGPVDAVWIENMNTVLDDNKKLCLVSGEIIQMSSSMNMIFEPQDLEVASPATVSRCGMVYYEPHQLGMMPSLGSWLNTLPETVSMANKEIIESLFRWLVPPALRFLRKELREVSPSSDNMMAWGLFKMVDSMLTDFKVEDPKQFKMSERDSATLVEGIFLFCLTWTICASVDSAGRERFNEFIKESTAGTVPAPYNEEGERGNYMILNPYPKEGNIYQYYFDTVKGKWNSWTSKIDREPFDVALQPHEIIVPTIDTTRYTFLLDICCRNAVLNHDLNRMAFLLVGPTGTGKTIYINNHLLNGLSPDEFTTISLGFSAQTSAMQTQDIIDGKLDKRRKGVYGPPVGKKCIVFIDDLNMPTKEVYGAQPPIEILRQYLDHNGWYDNKEKTFRNIIDMMYVCAMGPPGGGRTFITQRFLRWFNVISVTEFDNEAMTGIFESIVKFEFDKKAVSSVIKGLKDAVIKSTMDVYNSALEKLLPTPMKSHYLFNLRDFGRVIFGFLMGDTNKLANSEQVARLWVHEILRVYYDRLNDDADREWLIQYIREVLKKNWSLDLNKIMEHLITEADEGNVGIPQIRRLIFTDFCGPEGKGGYAEVPDPQKAIEVCNTFLDDYNVISKKPMQLVLFLFMIEHISRVCRVLRSPGGNALLVGIGGSGRQSCTRLASFIMDFTVVEIEISKTYGKNEWREDLKKLLSTAGGDGKSTTFLFTDSQIKYESFVEDINNLLNTAEVPNLFASDEKATLGEKVRPAAKQQGKALNTPAEAWAFFIERCKSNLHVVLAFSPIGDAFRSRLRQFPSLVNCCTIDWFTIWPDDALKSVASRFLQEVEMAADVRERCVEMCIEMHVSARKMSEKFFTETRRRNYMTPTSYLELIGTYKTLLGVKRENVTMLIRRYKKGLEALSLAEESVGSMKQELLDLQPGLVKAQQDTAALTEKVEAKVPEVEAQKAVAQKDEEATAAQAADVKKVKDECEADLAEAIPILNDALKALDTIKKQDIDLVKSMGKPPAGVQLAMKAVLVMLEIKPEKKPDPDKPGARIDDWWSPAVKLLGAGTLLQTLKEYDKEHIPPKVIERIRKEFKPDENFTPQQIAKASSAAEGLCKWVLAMEGYDRVAKIVAPKKEKLAKAEAELSEAMKDLEAKRSALKVVVDELNGLKDQLTDCAEKSRELQEQEALCQIKLERAEQLISGLGGEKSRWTTVAEDLEVVYKNLTGDVLISSGYVAYLGAFMRHYRDEITREWVSRLAEQEVPRSETFSLESVLGDPVKIRDWVIFGLPADSFSVENGIVVSTARRWPLCIDPQGQANKYFRNMEKNNKIKIVKLTDSDFIRTLENSVQFGSPVLLENVLEELDPSLEPLLLKQTFKQGGVTCIRLGDATIEYSKDFRFYITTKLSNPHYMPEIAVKVTLLNFMITQDGLQDQLLGIVVARERPELEEEKNALILQSADNKRKLKETEDKILEVLSAEGNILENEEGIQVLKDAKIIATDIEEKQKIADETERQIDEARAGYTDIAWRSSILFFAVSALANIEPMYQYSLTWYVGLFIQAIQESQPSSDLEQRLKNLYEQFTYFLYKMVCRSLFEKDKLIFSFLLCTRMMAAEGKIQDTELTFLVTGGVAVGDIEPNPHSGWLSDKSWGEIVRFSDLEQGKNFKKSVGEHEKEWKAMFESAEPFNHEFPGSWKEASSFTRLMVIRCIRPDKIVPAVMLFVAKEMGQKFIEPPPFDLAACYEDSNSCSPLIFILSAGADPNAALFKLADQKGFSERMKVISLGQGQGPSAARFIQEYYEKGGWVVLQNCHVYGSWMTSLERICEEFRPDTANSEFRLWLTSYPSDVFPVSVLQNGIKMTNEPAKGIRLNVKGSLLADPIANEEFFNSCKKPQKWVKLCYALVFFHALIQERRSFGPLGWNIPYEFTAGDMSISIRQTKMMLDEYEEDQFKALNYLIGECNYGGRVTDDKDRRYLLCALADFYNPHIFEDDYRFSPSGVYRCPPETPSYEELIDFTLQLPLTQMPEIFGLHENADITKDQQETNYFCDTVLQTESGNASGGGASGGSRDDALDHLAEDMLKKLPQVFDRDKTMKKFPIKFEESMNTVLAQELIRYNSLIEVIRSSLANLRKALKGLIVMSADLEQVQIAINTNKVPALWAKKSYPSLKPLGGYLTDLVSRITMFQQWIDTHQPAVFWLSGFFFVHAFMTGAMQNFARKYTIPVDTLTFEHLVMKEDSYASPPEDGVYVNGMFAEGCRWNKEKHILDESEPKVLFAVMPIFWFRPAEMTPKQCVWQEEKRDENGELIPSGYYVAPLYNTAARRGVLATTGHSSNFVCPIVIPSEKPESHWIKRGAALLMQLSD